MKITDSGGVRPPELQKSEFGREKAAVRGEREGRDTDSVTLSEKAREIRRLQIEVSKIPEVRPDRVERVKNMILNGTYQIRPEAVAEKILEEIFTFSRRV
ncbi:MAG: flagellar biosynthesis anti-sigma factor FlgM [Deltaproteobacteria bacterium]|nr:MAG: flagellar biosynthesis anti-sigma factor FlgM [Deltaproteobacteria bacterium]